METKDVLSIIDRLRKAKLSELLLVSIFVLPLYLSLWIFILEQLNSFFWDNRLFIVLILLLLYLLGLLIMKYFKTTRIAKNRIINYLKLINKELISFERIRNDIDSTYSNDFLNSMIEKYDTVFKGIKVKNKGRGLRILEQVEQEEE